jgi:hypothetical protein
MALLFLLVFSAKLLLMREHSMTVPFWDQWDAEARAVYVPYSACGLSWSEMFNLHNEHRVFFTRLLALDLLGVNRQWDPRLQQVASAALHSLTAVLLAVMLWLANARRRLDWIVFLVGLAFALPFAWHNTLFGFQSAFYLLLFFSVLGLWMTTRYAAPGVPWTLGCLCALCALFTAAGGVLLPPVIAIVAILKWLDDRRTWRDALWSLAGVAILLVAGFLSASPPLAHHENLRARGLVDFGGALAHNLAWPWVNSIGMSVLMWLPIAALLVRFVRKRAATTVIERFVIGIAAWVALQAAAIAYGRGAGGAVPDGRYEDFFSIGFIANAVALGLAVLHGTGERTSARRLATIASVGWLVIAAIGLNVQVDRALIELNSAQRYWDIQTVNVRRFVQTRELSQFLRKRPPEIPFPSPTVLATLLEDPYIRRILPSSVRQPMHLEPRTITNGAFVPQGTYPIVPRDPLAQVWGSYTEQGNGATGTFESQPIECQLGGHLLFDVSGYAGMTRETLALTDMRTERQVQIRPRVWAREDWLQVVVPCPAHPFTVFASDARSDYWLAFREPVETGRLSPTAEWLIASSPALLLAAFALGVIASRQH